MNTESKARTAPSINGHMIPLGAEHSIAIYERNGVCWVAEFCDGHGTLEYANSWFRFHAGGLRYCHNGRATLRFSAPLTPEMLQKIDRLHAESDARQERMLAVPRTIAAAAQRWAISLVSSLRGRESKTSQTLGRGLAAKPR
jgi:hypothetical protein